MDAVRDNLTFSLEAWPEAGITCDFSLPPNVFLEALGALETSQASVAVEERLPRLSTSLRGRLNLQLSGNKLRVRGLFAVKVEFVCDRCLTGFVGRLEDKFDETVFLTDSSLTPPEDMSLDMRETSVPLHRQTFDLTPLIGEFFWLAWPYQILCKPDCAGLCPTCGANLNEIACDCDQSKPTKH